jgi:glycine/D-amino acid oxidase-like deaminating enzyme
MRRHVAAVAVIGAGLTGAVVALELARAGTDVILIEQDRRPMNRASLRNEGKVHLGFVFAHDESLATSRLMIEGALTFRSVLSRLTDGAAQTLTASTPFLYLVPQNSLLPPDELERRFTAIEAAFLHRMSTQPGLDYLGTRPDRVVRRGTLAAVSDYLCTDRMAGAFLTKEVAVDTVALAEIVRAAITAQTLIRCLPGHRAACVQRLDGGFRVHGFADGEPWQVEAAQVVNATWESRFTLDRTVGIAHSPGWCTD